MNFTLLLVVVSAILLVFTPRRVKPVKVQQRNLMDQVSKTPKP